jgi:hypothetical protein
MFFGRRQRIDPRAEGWRALAADLELTPWDDLAGRLHDELGLGPGAVAPVYALSRPGQPRLVLFDQARERVGPTGRVASLRSCVLVRAEPEVRLLSMRVTERLGKAMELIEAGRTGSQRVETGVDPEFDRRLAVYARDEGGARSLLCAGTPAAELPPGRGRVPPVVVVGGRNVLLLLEEPEPVAFDRLASSAVDMLALYVALMAATPGGTDDQP